MSSSHASFEERRLLGIGLVFCAYLLFTTLDSSAKWLGLIGMPAIQIMFMRYAVHLGIVAVVYLPREGKALWQTRNLTVEVLRSAALIGSTLCNFTAVRYLPLTVTGAIGFTTPLIICVLSVFLLKEQVGWRRWTAIAVGFIGVLIIVRPGTETFHPATLLSIGGAFCYGFYAMLTRKLVGVDSVATQQFFASGLATLLLIPFAFLTWQWPTTTVDWIVFLLIGVIGFSGHQLITLAHRHAPASILAPFAYVQIIFIAVASWLVFNQPPEIWFYLGAPVVIGSGFYLWLRERQLAKPLTPVTAEDR